MIQKIDGPRIPAASGKTRQLIVILHGYGADGHDLIEIGRQWQGLFPDAAFVAPHAHEPCAMSPGGRQWFNLTDRNPHERWSGAVSARSVIDPFLDAELATHSLTDADLALVGFSQGAMMALHVGLRRPKAPAAVLAYSGLLVGPEHIAEASARDSSGNPPPVLLVHGSHDDVVPVESLFSSGNQLADASIPVQWHLALGLGHGIDGEGIRQGACFLSHSFGLGTPDLPRRQRA
ncbi:MAG: alpha/beta hydrolase [Beijerinckiaceae bacterium]